MSIGMFAAVDGLMAAQRALDVASHNVANSNTPGFSRQQVTLETTAPQGFSGFANGSVTTAGMVGTGVSVESITRVRNQYVDTQMRTQTSALGNANVSTDTMTQVQNIFNEPSANGLSEVMKKFWSSWQDLSTNPESPAYRIALSQNSQTLATTFNQTSQKLTSLRHDLDTQVGTTVTDINSITGKVAALNKQISASLAAGQNPNDLQDSRDQLLQQLSSDAKIQISTTADGNTNVYISGQPLVDRDVSFNLYLAPNGSPQGFSQVNYSGTNLPIAIPGGKLNQLLQDRDATLSDLAPVGTNPPGFMYQLNQLATKLSTAVNIQHAAGFGLNGTTGLNFFIPAAPTVIDASNIAVNPTLINSPNLIAAAANDPGSLTGGPGDAGNAVAIAQLQSSTTVGLGPPGSPVTFDSFFTSVMAQAGTQGQEAQREQNNQTALVKSIQDRISQVSGVSTDEEMAHVLQFQKAYAASARVLSTIDQMMTTLLAIQ